MKLEELKEKLLEGKKIRREEWYSHSYVFKMYKGYDKLYDNHEEEYYLDFDDLFADDWEVYEEPKKTLCNKLIKYPIREGSNEYIYVSAFYVDDVKEAIQKVKETLIERIGKATLIHVAFKQIFGEELLK